MADQDEHVNIVVSVDDKASGPLKDINESIRGTKQEAKGFGTDVLGPITQGASKFAESIGIPSKAIDALGDSFHKAKAPVGDLALAVKGMAQTAVSDMGGLAKTTGIVVDTVGVLTATLRIAGIAAVGLGTALLAVGKAMYSQGESAQELKHFTEMTRLSPEFAMKWARVGEQYGLTGNQAQAGLKKIVDGMEEIAQHTPAGEKLLRDLSGHGKFGAEVAAEIKGIAEEIKDPQERMEKFAELAAGLEKRGAPPGEIEKYFREFGLTDQQIENLVHFKNESKDMVVVPPSAKLIEVKKDIDETIGKLENLKNTVFNAFAATPAAGWMKELNKFLEENKGVIGETILTFLEGMAKFVHDIAVAAPPVISLINTITGLPKAAARRLGLDVDTPMVPIKGSGVLAGAQVREGSTAEAIARRLDLLEGQKEPVGGTINEERLALERAKGLRKGTDVEEKGPLAPLLEELIKNWWRKPPTIEEEEAAGLHGAEAQARAKAAIAARQPPGTAPVLPQNAPAEAVPSQQPQPKTEPAPTPGKSSSLDFGIITPAAAGEIGTPGAAAFGDVQHARRRYREIAQPPATETKPAAEAPATFAERFGALPTKPLNTLAEEALRASAALAKLGEAVPVAAPTAAATPAMVAAPAAVTPPATAADVQHARRRYREMMQPPPIELPEITTTPTEEAPPATFAERFGTPPTTEKPTTLTEEALRASALKRQADEGEPAPAEMTPAMFAIAEAAFAERFEGTRGLGPTGEATETSGAEERPTTLAEEAQRASEALSNLSEAAGGLAGRFGAASAAPDNPLAKIGEALRASQIKVPSNASPMPFSLGDVNASKLPLDTPTIDDRSLSQLLEASMAAHSGTTRVEGSAKIQVDVNAPRGVGVTTSTSGDLFQEVELNRSSQMAMADDSA